MTMNARRRRAQARLAAIPGVRAVRRPVSPGGAEQFDLFYVRAGLKSAHPLLILPGGPGVASVAQYRSLRRRAAVAGLDVIMVEHRGIGLSRHTDSGADLPPEAITVEQVVDDIVAVLDDAGVHSAILYGTSYGTYIAAGVGVRHPGRVTAMVLDSPLLSTGDIDVMRAALRGLLLDGTDPDGADLVPKVRRLIADGAFADSDGQLAGVVYGYGGAALLGRLLDLLLCGRRWVWSGMDRIARISQWKAPYRNETDLVGRIAFRELDYAGRPDGLPLDPAIAIREIADVTVGFEAEPFDLAAEMPAFSWPTVVISGGRDLTTPPVVAHRIAGLIPHSVLVELPTAGHSILDTRERAAFEIIAAVRRGSADTLPARAGELDALPVNYFVRMLVSVISSAAVAESVLPAAVPKVLARVRAS